jgi:hypothetical protein
MIFFHLFRISYEVKLKGNSEIRENLNLRLLFMRCEGNKMFCLETNVFG